jgi:hypothetical protein
MARSLLNDFAGSQEPREKAQESQFPRYLTTMLQNGTT